MKPALILAQVLSAISLCWGQSSKPQARLEAEYYVVAYAQPAQPGTIQVAGKEGSTCLILKPEIADGKNRNSPASDLKRRRESLRNVNTCSTMRLISLKACGT